MIMTQLRPSSVGVQPKLPEPTIWNTADIGRLLTPLIAKFDADLNYTGAISGDDLEGLLRGMHEQAIKIGIPYPEGSHSWYSFNVGVYYAHLCFPSHPLNIRVYTGIYTWLAVLVDDGACKDPNLWQNFMIRFQTGLEQVTLLAQAWADYLRLSYKYYSPIVANFIVTSSLNFTNANALEGSELPFMSRTTGGKNWPYYLRDKDGLSEAYVWMTFPKELYPDISSYMEAIPDMNKYISFTNDILSFYKEEKAGEEDNYMHSRASYEGKDIYTVFKEVIQENIDAHRRIQVVLCGREPYGRAWHEHAMGFVAMHKAMGRYRLHELGLGESYTDSFGRMTSTRQR
ncbi:isoprenoid synthase domain-containing protein [Hypoxylon argillaceum]|nr:isoprenoid synthase domain-containing protein [Hypoxylon argillaceum]KAI1153641.1 isoprenoid synthase domain-containing protein [Nemania diffusa]